MKRLTIAILALTLAACATITPAKVDRLAASLQAASDRAGAANDVGGQQCWARGLTYIPALRIIAKPSTGVFDSIEQAHLLTMMRDQEKDVRADCAVLLADLRSILGLTPTRRLGLPF